MTSLQQVHTPVRYKLVHIQMILRYGGSQMQDMFHVALLEPLEDARDDM
jgi:hypothetical protein